MIVDLTAYSKPASAGSVGFAGAAGAGLEGAWEAVAEGEASAACGASADGWAGSAGGGRVNLTNYRSGALNRRWGGRGDRGRACAVRLGRCWRGNDMLDGGRRGCWLRHGNRSLFFIRRLERRAPHRRNGSLGLRRRMIRLRSGRCRHGRQRARPDHFIGRPSLDGRPGSRRARSCSGVPRSAARQEYGRRKRRAPRTTVGRNHCGHWPRNGGRTSRAGRGCSSHAGAKGLRFPRAVARPRLGSAARPKSARVRPSLSCNLPRIAPEPRWARE